MIHSFGSSFEIVIQQSQYNYKTQDSVRFWVFLLMNKGYHTIKFLMSDVFTLRLIGLSNPQVEPLAQLSLI